MMRHLMIIICSLLKGEDMESLLFHFLDDWLYKFCADLFFIPRVSLLLSQLLMNKCYLYEIQE